MRYILLTLSSKDDPEDPTTHVEGSVFISAVTAFRNPIKSSGDILPILRISRLPLIVRTCAITARRAPPSKTNVSDNSKPTEVIKNIQPTCPRCRCRSSDAFTSALQKKLSASCSGSAHNALGLAHAGKEVALYSTTRFCIT
jgi:hypothetical protein